MAKGQNVVDENNNEVLAKQIFSRIMTRIQTIKTEMSDLHSDVESLKNVLGEKFEPKE